VHKPGMPLPVVVLVAQAGQPVVTKLDVARLADEAVMGLRPS